MNSEDLDDKFNKLKHSLPILYKINKNEFYTAVKELKNLTPFISLLGKIDLFYTFHSLGIRSIWLTYLQEIFDDLNFNFQVELLRFSSFYVYDETEIQIIKDFYFSTVNNLSSEDEIMTLCFIDGNFFKPLLHSSLKTMKMINTDLIFFITELCLEKIIKPENIITCLERLVTLRNLTEKEIEHLKILSYETEFLGRVIDILLRCGREDTIKIANEIILRNTNTAEKYYESEHGVHYFEILPDAIEKINNHEGSLIFETVHEMLNFGKILSTTRYDLDNLYHLANMVITTNYNYVHYGSRLKLTKCFTFAWDICNLEERKYLIEEVFLLGNVICCYGLMVNILTTLTGLGKGIFLYENDFFSKRDQALLKIKKRYTQEDDFWTDAINVEKEIEKEMIEIEKEKNNSDNSDT